MKIFCIGIGGIGLSGVAQILKSQGHEISGSDSSTSQITASLTQSDIKVYPFHNAENLDADTDWVIYSEAIPENNPERMRAQELNIKNITNYAQALATVTEGKKLIAITGTHGKTTVTGMLAHILIEAAKNPSIIIGSRIDLLGGRNYRAGGGELFLAEACEYRDNFLTLKPHVMLVNNLEPDHLDYFKTADSYYAAYQKLAEKIPEDGSLIIFEEDAQKLDLSKVKAAKKILKRSEKPYALQIPGKHNQQNAFAAETVAKVLGINQAAIDFGLRAFHGTWRRFEFKGFLNGAKVYDDYGHHPTEIRATIQAARELYPEQNLVVIFQPHQYSRTREFFEEFTKCFTGATHVIITDIYQARDNEEDIASTSAKTLVEELQKIQPANYIPLEMLANTMESTAHSNTIFLVMGAGNINRIFDSLAPYFQQTPL